MSYLDRIFASLERFESIKNVENDHALFLTSTPHIAPAAYLNIVFKPASREVRREVAQELDLPEPLVRLYSETNGFHLLETLYVYGLLPRNGYLIDRADPFAAPVWDLRHGRRIASPPETSWLAFGGYGEDHSLFIERRSGVVCAARMDDLAVTAEWPSLEEWLQSELDRLVPLFDGQGRTSTSGEERLPSSESTTVVLREPGQKRFIAPPLDLNLPRSYWERVRAAGLESTPITLCRDGRDVAISNAYYAYDHGGNATPGWNPDWAVVTTEDLRGDPIFIDRKRSDQHVFTLPRELERREPAMIACSLDVFVESTGLIERCLGGDGDREQAVRQIAVLNSGEDVDLDFWTVLIERSRSTS